MRDRNPIDILLVDPSLGLEENYGPLLKIGSSLPSIGLLILAACLREAGKSVELIHAGTENISIDELVNRIAGRKPIIVGFRTVACTINNTARICSKLKEIDPGIITLIGGPHATAVPTETLLLFPEIDFAIIGEGELSLPQFVNAVSDGEEYQNIQGLAFRDSEGKITINGHSPFVKNLDELPFPAHDLLVDFPDAYHPSALMYKKLPSTNLIFSRGCTGKCIYCDRNVFGNHIRCHSPEYIFELIMHLKKKYGIRDFVFYDDNFVLWKKSIIALCMMITDNKVDITWSSMARIDFIDQDLLNAMKDAGCWQISYGIESGSPKVLKILKKGYDVELVDRVLTWTYQAGINAKGYFMMGTPGETLETINETINHACRIKLYDFEISKCTPLPNTELANRIDEFGVQNGGWDKMTNLNPVFIPKDLTAEALEREYKRVIRKFYLRPKIVFSYIKRLIANPELIGRIFLLAKAFFSLQLQQKSKRLNNIE